MRKAREIVAALVIATLIAWIGLNPPPRPADPAVWPEYDWECWQFPIVCKYPQLLDV